MDVCTIIAKNYVAFARVLARSFAERHADRRCWALVIDGHEGFIDPAEEPFELLTIDDLGIERFDRMSALYDVLELSTAVKPWLMRHLLDVRGVERVAYLDPDIRIYDSLAEVDRLLGDNRVVVTPHLTEPMPRDGHKPSESDILIAGAYNLGFLGLSRGEDTLELLDWWAERLETDCVLDPERGYFVDQRWIDFAPGLVDSFHVLRDPGYNVAYWNLAGRRLSERGGRIEVNDRPLRFFHFSGFKPERRDRLSTHQDRILVATDSPLRKLCDGYADELLANGYEEAVSWPYDYAELPNGLKLDRQMRQVYRDAVLEDALDKPVFEPAGAQELLDYLNGPAKDGGDSGVTRYLHALWEEHRQLQIDFPDLRGPDALHLVAWAESGGGIDIPPQLLPSNATRPARIRATAPRAGVNLAGYFSSTLGVGQVARNVVDALECQNVAVSPVGLVGGDAPQGERTPVGGSPAYASFPINLVCVNADAVPAFVADRGPDFFAGRHTIGLWWWEVSEFPDRWLSSFEHVDEVWTGTHHVADAIAAKSPVPVVKVTIPVDVPSFEPRSRAELGMPDGFCFLFSFDYSSVFERKNPLAAIEAFALAFEAGSGASLVVKCINSERDPDNHARVLAAAARHPDVHVIDRHLPREEKSAMLAASDCFVSLHRSEGLGLELAEAMWLGKPVIATGYSGNLEYMTAGNSYLVDHRLVPIGPGNDPYPARGEWAEPDVASGAGRMREVFDGPEAARERGAVGQREIRETHSADAAGRTMARRLVQIQSRWGLRSAGIARDRRGTVNAGRIARRIRSGPAPPNPARFGRLRHRLRDWLLRMLRPYTVFQRDVNQDLLNAIQSLDNALQGLATAQAQLRPQLHRLVSETQATPPAGAGLELREHPRAGLVSGFDAQAREPARMGSVPAGGERLSAYLDLIGDRGPVLEVRCGEGELLHLLRERGIEYVAAEEDEELVERLRMDGHGSVEVASPMGVLSSRADGSLGAIVCRGVLERMSYEELTLFLEQCASKLEPGGMLLAESPNPHSAAALKSLWADPRTVRPVFPETALELARATGFVSGFVFHPGGSGNVEADRFYEPYFALVAETGGGAPLRSAADETREPAPAAPGAGG